MPDNQSLRIYQPELLPRKGELIAWLLSGVLIATWIILLGFHHRASWMLSLLLIFMLGSAISITLGNWMDRNTSLALDASGMVFSNGIRRTNIKWEEVRGVRVNPAAWGKRVQVIGEKSFFAFHTLGEVKYRGEVRGMAGFVNGDAILAEIIDHSRLVIVEQTDKGYYYARK